MSANELQRATQFAVKRIVETLEGWDEPWRDDRQRIPEFLEWKLMKQSFAEWPELWPGLDSTLDTRGRLQMAGEGTAPRHEAKNRDSLGATLARIALKAVGMDVAEDSKTFADFSLEMERLQLGLSRVMEARADGDSLAEDKFKAYYRRVGYLPSGQEAASALTPTLSDAWREYASEKKGGPQPAWSDKTARGQEAIFNDWREIVGDIRVGEVTRDAMLRYRAEIARVPANYRKRYAGKSIAELLTMDIPADRLPRARTVQEKLIQVGAFLKWCRETKRYLTGLALREVHS